MMKNRELARLALFVGFSLFALGLNVSAKPLNVIVLLVDDMG